MVREAGKPQPERAPAPTSPEPVTTRGPRIDPIVDALEDADAHSKGRPKFRRAVRAALADLLAIAPWQRKSKARRESMPPKA